MHSTSRAHQHALKIAAIVALMTTAACGRWAESADDGTGPDEITIVVASSAVDANISKMVDGMKDLIPEVEDEEDVKISLEVMDAGLNSDKQISQIQDAIVKKPDVLVVDPVDLGPLTSIVQQAKDQDIKVYSMRPGPDDPEGLWDGIADESQLEVTMTENMRAWMQSGLDADDGLTYQVGVIYGGAAQTAQLIRGDVIKTMAEEEPSKVTVVAEKIADWSLQTAQDATSDFITSEPDMNLVVTANNQMGLGAVNAVNSAGKSGDVTVATYDIDAPTAKAIKDGKIAYATGFELYGYGQGVLRGAVRLALGEPTDEFDVPVLEVTKDNADDVLAELH
jgi:ABC-type sugar transport system substrate-binding protein